MPPTLDESLPAAGTGATVSYSSLSPLSADVSSIYKPYSNEEFENYDGLYLDNGFFPFAPEEVRMYLWRVMRRNLWWYRGFVPGLHNQGVLSLKLGSRVCKRMAELTMVGGFRVEGYDTAEAFLEKFNTRNKTRLKLTKQLPELNAIGNMLAKIDMLADNSLRINFIPGNKYFASVDEELNITQFIALIAFIAPAPTMDAKQVSVAEEGFYLVEQRKLDGTTCYQRYALYRSPTGMNSGGVFNAVTEVEAKLMNDRVKKRVERIIGKDNLGKVFTLPCKGNIWAAPVLNAPSCTGTKYNGFADSTLEDAHTALFQYDVTQTQKEANKYLAQTGVLIPDTMIPPEVTNNPSGNAQAAYLQNQRSLDSRVYKKIQVTNPSGESNKPVFFQADNQAQTYNEDLKDILANIATLCGMTPGALAGNLSSGGFERTATEVLNEDDITRATVETKRDLIREPMTQLYRWVLEHYGVSNDGSNDEIDMVFNSSIMGNPERETKDIISQLGAGLISKKKAIARKNRGYSKKEIEEELAEIRQDKTADVQAGADGIWNAPY